MTSMSVLDEVIQIENHVYLWNWHNNHRIFIFLWINEIRSNGSKHVSISYSEKPLPVFLLLITFLLFLSLLIFISISVLRFLSWCSQDSSLKVCSNGYKHNGKHLNTPSCLASAWSLLKSMLKGNIPIRVEQIRLQSVVFCCFCGKKSAPILI